MTNLEFSAPYNGDPETLKEVLRLKKLGDNRIREVYLSGPQKYSGSGRVADKLSLSQFITLVDEIHKAGIRVNLVLNPTCEGSNWYHPKVVSAKMEYLRLVHKEHGVEAVTMANPIYIQEVRRLLPDIEICASVLGDIDCIQRAVLYSRAGANVITPDVNINRDLELLREIKQATGAELKLLLNEGCLYKCPFRKFHFNYLSHKSKELGKIEGEGFFNYCLGVTSRDHSQILKSGWIRPEDTRKYSGITNFFKIVGRSAPRSMVIRFIEAYLKENWDGDLLDLMAGSLNLFAVGYGGHLDNKSLDNYDFFERVTSCDKKCIQCDYCEELSGELIKLGVLTREKVEDVGLKGIKDVISRLAKIGELP